MVHSPPPFSFKLDSSSDCETPRVVLVSVDLGGRKRATKTSGSEFCSAKVFESKDRNSVLTWMNIHPYTDLQLHTVSRSWQIFYIIL